MASLSLKIGQMEFAAEGDEDWISKKLDLILSSPAAAAGAASTSNTVEEPEDVAAGSTPAKPKKKKRVVQKPPPGASCRDRILILKGEGFFSEKRSAADISAGLEKKGFTHNTSQVGAALTPMFNKGEIQRTKEGSGWVYFWDRD